EGQDRHPARDVGHPAAARLTRSDKRLMARNALRSLSRDVDACRQCELWERATQAVIGEGPVPARLVLVGEQPGDQEDRAGRPFVGPAGDVLNRALREAGVPRDDLYVTNAVKHFKFEERGKRRIHQTPSGAEVSACRPWVETELEIIRPKLIVCLGA